MTNTQNRFQVRTIDSPLRKIREPHRVVDTMKNEIVDEYASKRAAQMDARDRNARYDAYKQAGNFPIGSYDHGYDDASA